MSPTQTILLQEERAASYWRSTAAAMCSSRCIAPRASAMQLGLDVIVTDHGGNTHFCTGPLAHPVRCREVPIPRGAYPCADGHEWGEPDLEHAAELMQQVAARQLALAADPAAAAAVDPSRNPAVLAGYRQRFSFAAAGARYRARLEGLWGERRELAGRLRWRADTPV